jgi:hypothetical protein
MVQCGHVAKPSNATGGGDGPGVVQRQDAWPWGLGEQEVRLSGAGPAVTVLRGSALVEQEGFKPASGPKGGDTTLSRWGRGERSLFASD